MARYSSYGNLDEQIIEDMDMGFVMFDNRLRPDQLPRGTLVNSSNGRMGLNGEWEVRRGIENISAPFTNGSVALTIPFYTYGTINTSNVSRSGQIVTLIFAIAPSLPFINGSLVKTQNLFGGTPSASGNRIITVVNPTTVTFTMVGDETFIWTSGLAFVGTPIIDDTSVNAIYGSCLYSNPSATTDAYIILAANSSARAVNLADPNGAAITIAYPAGVAVSAEASMLQAFNKVFIFRDGAVALEWNGVLTGSPAFTLVKNGNYTTDLLIANPNNTEIANGLATVTTSFAHGFTVGTQLIVVKGDGIIPDETIVNVSAVTTSPTNTFSFYIAANSGSDAHVITAASKGSGHGIVTITTALEHDYASNDHVKISGLTYTVGVDTNPNGTWRITVTGLNNFTYDIGGGGGVITYGVAGSPTAKLQSSLEFIKKQSSGIGFSHMPTPPWATYHQRRLWMPFRWTMTGTSGTPAITSRGIADELIVSDILDSDTYDQVYNEYRFNAGRADFLVAAHAFSDDKLVVFNRESIHIVVSSSDVANSSVQLITNEVGCLARRSIQQIGDNIIFLSDNGVYGTSFVDLYNLRGNVTPLSSSIDATIKRINSSYSKNAVSAYFDNRYYLAVPLNPTNPDLPAATANNSILIFNFLNKGWESIDSVDNVNWNIKELFAGGSGADRGLYAISEAGAIHRIDYRNDSNDIVSVSIGENSATLPILASATTRMFNFGIIDKKRWNNYELHLQSSGFNISDATLSAEIENADQIVDLGSISSKLGEQLAIDEDATIRGRIGNYRGYGLQFTFTPTAGRPKLRAIKVGGSTTSRSSQSIK
jgi:hypothetical protein